MAPTEARSEGECERERAAARVDALFRDRPGDDPFEGPLSRLVEDLHRRTPTREEG